MLRKINKNLKLNKCLRIYTVSLFETISDEKSSKKIAVKTKKGSYTFYQLNKDTKKLSESFPEKTHEKEKISFLFNPSYEYIVAKMAIWL